MCTCSNKLAEVKQERAAVWVAQALMYWMPSKPSNCRNTIVSHRSSPAVLSPAHRHAMSRHLEKGTKFLDFDAPKGTRRPHFKQCQQLGYEHSPAKSSVHALCCINCYSP